MSVVLATAGYDHKIRFWEAPNGVCIRIIKFVDSQINRLEITPDKQFIAAAGNPYVRLYEIHNGGGQYNNSSSSTSGGSNSLSPDTNNNGSHSHQQQQQQEDVLTLQGHTGNVTSLGFQRDGRYLYTGSEDGTIKVWDLRNPHFCRSFDVGCAVNSVCLRSDRDEFISGDQNGFVKFWDLSSTERGPVHSIKPSAPESQFEQVAANKGSKKDANESKEKSTATPSPPSSSGMSNDDSLLRSNLNAKPERRISAHSIHPHQHPRYSEGIAPIQAVDISEDSRTLVAASNHGTIFVWDSSMAGTKKSKLSENVDADADAAVENEGPVDDDAYGLRPIAKFRAHTEKPGTYCLYAKIAPDCRHLVTTASDGTAKLWDTSTWELSQSLCHQSPTQPSGGAGGSGNNTNLSSKWVWDAAFCADSSYLVTASSDHVSRLWNLRTGDVVRQYHGHQSAVTCVALNDSSV